MDGCAGIVEKLSFTLTRKCKNKTQKITIPGLRWENMMPELEPLCVEDNVSGCRLKPSALTAPRAPASQTSSLISPCMDTASVHTLYLHHSNTTPFLMGHLKSPSNQPALDPVVAMLLRRWQGRPSIVISVSVFSVFMRTSENTGLNYTKFSLHAARGHSHLSSGSISICYVLPVLWMM